MSEGPSSIIDEEERTGIHSTDRKQEYMIITQSNIDMDFARFLFEVQDSNKSDAQLKLQLMESAHLFTQ